MRRSKAILWTCGNSRKWRELVNCNSSVFDRNQTLSYSLPRVGAKSTSLGMALKLKACHLWHSDDRLNQTADAALFDIGCWATKDKRRSEEHTSELQSR